MCVVNDGYISGATAPRQKRCEHCGERTLCIDITGVILTKGVSVKATILQDRNYQEPKCIKSIGIGCGCYAKFHRQLVHITESRMSAGHAV